MKTPKTQGLPIADAIEKLKEFESSMTYEQLQEYKRAHLRPFRTKNLVLAGAIWAGVIAVCKLNRNIFIKKFM